MAVDDFLTRFMSWSVQCLKPSKRGTALQSSPFWSAEWAWLQCIWALTACQKSLFHILKEPILHPLRLPAARKTSQSRLLGLSGFSKTQFCFVKNFYCHCRIFARRERQFIGGTASEPYRAICRCRQYAWCVWCANILWYGSEAVPPVLVIRK